MFLALKWPCMEGGCFVIRVKLLKIAKVRRDLSVCISFIHVYLFNEIRIARPLACYGIVRRDKLAMTIVTIILQMHSAETADVQLY